MTIEYQDIYGNGTVENVVEIRNVFTIKTEQDTVGTYGEDDFQVVYDQYFMQSPYLTLILKDGTEKQMHKDNIITPLYSE